MKLQKIMLDGGFTCPNRRSSESRDEFAQSLPSRDGGRPEVSRDGRVAQGGCTFCLCESFNPQYCRQHRSIAQQLEAGKAFFRGKYPDMKYLAYFQAYTSTYAPIEVLRRKYDEALSVPDVVGLVVSTRPDCVDDEVLSLLDSIRHRGYQVTLELGCESFYDRTLERVNRGHTSSQSVEAIHLCHRYGIPLTIHLMLGLPG